MNTKAKNNIVQRCTLGVMALIIIAGCAGGPGAGSDTVVLNSTRGRPDAQISQAQARQYDTQRDQVAKEGRFQDDQRDRQLAAPLTYMRAGRSYVQEGIGLLNMFRR